MKIRERLKRIQKSKSWVERRALARDRLPGTRFDATIHHWMDIFVSMEESGYRPKKRETYFSKETGLVDIAAMNHDFMAAMGEDFARAFKNGNSHFFREWADAVDTWRNHKPQPDKLRTSLITFCVPPKGKFKMRDIIQYLRRVNMISKASKESAGLADVRRNVRRVCKELGIAIQGESGRPK